MTKTAKIIFTVSILFNLCLAGVVAGFLLSAPIGPPGPPKGLSPESARILKTAMQDANLKPLAAQMKQKTKEMESLIRAEKFDAAAYEKLGREILDLRARMAREKADAMGRALPLLPQEDREKMARRAASKMAGRAPPPP